MKIIENIINFFEKNNITYWIDSGTLLGFAREGQIIEWDRDIDIAVREELFTQKIHELSCIIDTEYYDVKVLYHKKKPSKYKLIPKLGNGQHKPINILIMREGRGILWAPHKYVIRGDSYEVTNIKFFLYGLWRYPIRKFAKRLFMNNSLFLFIFYKYSTWIYPSNLIGNPIFVDWAPGKVPQHWQEYLNYRYGNWRIPVKKWKYRFDDRAYYNLTPNKAIKKYNREILKKP